MRPRYTFINWFVISVSMQMVSNFNPFRKHTGVDIETIPWYTDAHESFYSVLWLDWKSRGTCNYFKHAQCGLRIPPPPKQKLLLYSGSITKSVGMHTEISMCVYCCKILFCTMRTNAFLMASRHIPLFSCSVWYHICHAWFGVRNS